MLAVETWYPVDEEDREESPRTSYELGPGIGLESAIAVDDLPVSKREKQSLLVFSHGYGGINTASAVCSAQAFPIEEAVRLQNIYVVSFFKRHLLGDRRYDAYLSLDYAERETAITFSARVPANE